MSPDAEALRRYFLGWQCRIRQLCVREHGGRPLAGMRPEIQLGDLTRRPRITTGMVKSEPAEATAQFRHLARKTPDAVERYEGALRMLSAHYYQHPETFSDRLTAVFSLESPLADELLERESCTLIFEHGGQRVVLRCVPRRLTQGSPGFEATYWHNLLFNPTLPPAVIILGLDPDWDAAKAQPPLT